MASNNLPSFRLPLRLPADLHQDVKEAFLLHDDAITDLQQAIPELKSQIAAATSSTTGTSSGTNTKSGSENVTIGTTSTIGTVNNQTGITAYATQQSDYGAFVILSDASAIAVTLTTGTVITTPWFATFINLGTGTTTLTPATGTINGSASFTVGTNGSCTVSYDGTNFFADPENSWPQNTPAILHEWLASYNAATGAFTQTQPAFTDISGIATVAQGGTGTSSPSLVPGSGISIIGSWPDQTVAATGGSGVTQIVAGTNVTISPAGGTGVVTVNASGGGGSYSLGGSLTTANVSIGAGAGSGASVAVVSGLDGNHQIQIATGTSPVLGGAIFTVTFTTSRGQPTYPIL